MVNIDELNESIEKFGTVADKLNTLGESAESIARTAEKQEELSKEVEKLQTKQVETVDLFKKQWTETQTAINAHIDNMEKHLYVKLDLTDHKIDDAATDMKQELINYKQELANYNQELNEKLKSIKSTQYITMAIAAIAAILVVVMHFI